jgi:phage-related protein
LIQSREIPLPVPHQVKHPLMVFASPPPPASIPYPAKAEASSPASAGFFQYPLAKNHTGAEPHPACSPAPLPISASWPERNQTRRAAQGLAHAPQQFRGRNIFAIGDPKGRAGCCGWDGCEGLSFGNLLHIVPNLVQYTMVRKTTPTLGARFFKTDAGTEPVRNWLKDLPVVERKAIGEDIETVQFGWPLGMRLVDHLEGRIWEVRTRLSTRIARVLFVLDGDTMVLLTGSSRRSKKHLSLNWIWQRTDSNY